MALVLANNASTTLASGINDSATSISVSSATGFPSISGSQFFYVTLDDATNVEIVKVTGVSGTTFTVVRAQDDTSASAFNTGTEVSIRITKLILKDNVVATLGALSGQTIADSGNLTIDVAGELKLDADGGNITLQDGGTAIGQFQLNDTNHLKLGSKVSNADIRFFGNDDGSTIVALILDMSDAGTAIFNNNIVLGDNGRVKFGDGGDMAIYHNATDTFIQNSTGSLIIENTLDDSDIVLKSDDGSGGTTAYLTLDGSAVTTFFNKNTRHTDNIRATFGSSSDLQIYHDGTHSYVANGTNTLYLRTASSLQIENSDGSEDLATFAVDGAVVLYHDGSSRFATDAQGANVTGTLDVSSKVAVAGGTEATSTDGSIRTEGGISAAKKIIAGTSITAGSFLQANGHISTGSNSGRLRAGASNEVELSHSGSHGELDCDTGNFLIDVAGDITLDADGGDIKFEDAGTHWLNFGNAAGSSAVHIDTKVSDHDLKFRGNDGGSTITALTLDMSEGGTATFNNGVVVGGDLTVQGTTVTLNTATLDVEDKNITLNAGSGDTSGSANGAGITIQDAVDASNDATILWDAGNDKFDFSHPINISHGTPVLTLTDTSSSATTTITLDGVNTTIDSNGTDGDIIFKGSDGGSEITALTLDMSAGGSASFSHDIYLLDNNRVYFGSDSDMEILHEGSYAMINNTTGNLFIRNNADDSDIIFQTDDGSGGITTYFFLDGSGTRTIFEQHTRHMDNLYAAFGSDADLRLFHDGTDSKIQQSSGATGNLIIEQAIDDKDIILKSDDGSGGVAAYITLDGSAALTQFDKDTKHVDNVKATFGDSADLQIYHDGSNNYIRANTTDQDLTIQGNDGGAILNALTFDMSANGAATFSGPITANAGINIDNISIDGTTASLSGSSDLTIDVGGRIDLSADDNGEVRLYDGSSLYAQFKDDDDRLRIQTLIQDKDMLFVGNDGGSEVTALTLDMSEGGTAQFAHDIEMVDNGLLRMGAGGDLILTSDGTNGTIFTNNGALILDADSDIHLDANGGDIYFKDNGNQFFRIQQDGGNVNIRQDTSDKDMLFLGNDGGTAIVALTLDMSEAGAATFNNNVTAFSDERLKDNIETLEDGLAKVEQLRGVTYTRDGRENIGVIAQEVEKILPEIVLTADDEMGTKSVDYSRLTAVLIEAVKDLSAKVKELENK